MNDCDPKAATPRPLFVGNRAGNTLARAITTHLAALRREELWEAYAEELGRLRALPRGSGGDFCLTLGARASKRFARALVLGTLEGQTSFTEAFRLFGLEKMATFHDLGHRLGMGV